MHRQEASLRRNFRYDPSTGILYKYGSPTGWVNGGRYLMITLLGKGLYVHRVAWFLHYGNWPKGEIDHIDRDIKNNRIDNLREATRTQNRWNAVGNGDIHGRRSGRWDARITVNRKRIYLGSFETEAEARAARTAAEDKYYGTFAPR